MGDPLRGVLLLLLVSLVAGRQLSDAAQDAAGDALLLTHKLLLITTSKHRAWATGFLEQTMMGYGAPLEVLQLDTVAPPDFRGFLWDGPNSGKYSGFIFYPDADATASLTQRQLSDLQDYQRRTGARAVRFASDPAVLGLTAAGPCTKTEGELRFTSATPLGVSGVRSTAVTAAGGITRCPAVPGSGSGQCCSHPTDAAPMCIACSVIPTLRVSPPRPVTLTGATPNAAATTAAAAAAAANTAAVAPTVAALATTADGRQSMVVFMECSEESLACWALAHVAVSWAARNVLPGQRRAYLSLQVDDIFLSTDSSVGGSTYRVTPADLQTHLAWQDSVSAQLPGNSSVRIELIFNGNGILLESGSQVALQNTPPCFATQLYRDLKCTCWGGPMSACPVDANWFCRSCVKDWKRPRGSAGVSYVPPPDSSSWNDGAFMAGDKLYRYLKTDPRARDGFFWASHTFSHQMLDNITADAMRWQLDLNAKMAGEAFLGLSSRPSYSRSSMVTPAISGLFNGDALAAIAAAGINTAVGDNTWPMLLNEASPYRMKYTTDAVNGYPTDGGFSIAVMPRWSTAIAFSSSTLQDAVLTYNSEQRSEADKVATIEALLASEADRVVRQGFMPLRSDGWMFHQANLRVLGSGGSGSLVMLWAEAALNKLQSVVEWPVRSLKLDDLKQHYLAREARDACDLTYRLGIDRKTGTVKTVTVSSGGAAGGAGTLCAAPMIVRGDVSLVDSPVMNSAVNSAVNGVGNVKLASSNSGSNSGGANGGGAGGVVTESDGTRTVVARVPAGGSVTLGVAGTVMWPVPQRSL